MTIPEFVYVLGVVIDNLVSLIFDLCLKSEVTGVSDMLGVIRRKLHYMFNGVMPVLQVIRSYINNGGMCGVQMGV